MKISNPLPRDKWLLGAFVILACASIFVGIQMSTKAQMTSPTEGRTSDKKPQVIRYDDPLWSEKMHLSRMASESAAIAVVTTVSNVGKLTSEPQGVDTVYSVTVGEAIKGSLGKEISVSLPGGLARAADGSLLLSQTQSIASMGNNKTYVLFLTRNTGGSADFSTVRGSQGIYELPADGSGVIHLGSVPDPPPAPPREEQSVFLAAARRLGSE